MTLACMPWIVFFDDADAAPRFLEAGNDILMICAHFTDTDRIIALAEAMQQALKDDDFCQNVAPAFKATGHGSAATHDHA